jgi:hypothetical protein
VGNVIAFILDQIISPFWPYIAGAFGIVMAFIMGRVGGGAKRRAKQAEATVRRVETAEAEADLRAGKTPEDIVRGHDNAWR